MAWTRPRSGPIGVRHTGCYRDPAGHTRSAGTWFDRTAGRISFADYVETVWWPSCTSRSPPSPAIAAT